MKQKNIKSIILCLQLLFVLILTSCQPGWEIPVIENGHQMGVIDKQSVAFYFEKYQDDVPFIPLGQMFYHTGFILIDEVSFITDNSSDVTFAWDKIAENTMLSKTGEVVLGDSTSHKPDGIEVKFSDLLIDIEYSIMDISPTVLNAMELPDLPQAFGKPIYETKTDHAVIILLDGMQYQTLYDMASAEQLPFLGDYANIQKGLSVYPSISTSGSAAFLTGLPPNENGVYGYGNRTTESTTLFDLAVQEGKSVIAVEGSSLPFNLRNAETVLCGDKDGNGLSDDNVHENALDIINSGMPDLLYIHFHDIDDLGHTYGPGSNQYASAIKRVDRYLSDIYASLPESTLLVIFADHGMHTTSDGGTHGTLTKDDLIIPIIFLEK